MVTFSGFKAFVNNPGNYDSLSGAVVSTFTGMFARVTVGGTYVENWLVPQVDASSAQRARDGRTSYALWVP